MKGSRVCLLKIWLEVQDTLTLNIPLWLYWLYWLVWAAATWKIADCGERLPLNSLYLPKDKSSKRSLIVINSLPRSFINQGHVTHHRKGARSRYHTQTNFSITYHISHLFLLRVHLSFLKIICSPLRYLHSSFTFLIKMVFKSEF